MTIRDLSALRAPGDPHADIDPGQGALHPVLVNRPAGAPRVEAGIVDLIGRPVTVSCASCHANFEPDRQLNDAAELTEFHQGLAYDHGHPVGRLTCATCHNPENYNQLRLADGRALEFTQVQTLCAQCHAPQARDFERGVHGGMTGYWDLARGPQLRKGCIDCHDPHSPAFPAMQPDFRPYDRFLSPDRESGQHSRD